MASSMATLRWSHYGCPVDCVVLIWGLTFRSLRIESYIARARIHMRGHSSVAIISFELKMAYLNTSTSSDRVLLASPHIPMCCCAEIFNTKNEHLSVHTGDQLWLVKSLAVLIISVTLNSPLALHYLLFTSYLLSTICSRLSTLRLQLYQAFSFYSLSSTLHPQLNSISSTPSSALRSELSTPNLALCLQLRL